MDDGGWPPGALPAYAAPLVEGLKGDRVVLVREDQPRREVEHDGRARQQAEEEKCDPDECRVHVQLRGDSAAYAAQPTLRSALQAKAPDNAEELFHGSRLPVCGAVVTFSC